ncbi:MAG: hypothetical protein ACLTE2_13140 [Eubacteriales bacterium]
MGATADKIEAAVKAAPNYCEQEIVILHANSMEKAVALAKEQAQKGDICILYHRLPQVLICIRNFEGERKSF